jgi:MYXO-CTERM domain-containing protein
MSRPTLAALAAAAALLGAVPVSAFERSEDRSCGVCFYWPSRTVPYVVNPPDVGVDGELEASCGGSGVLDAVRLGFAAWSDPTCTDLALADGGVTSTSSFVGYTQAGPNENLVVFRRGICDDLIGQSDPCWRATAAGETCDAIHNCFLTDAVTSRSTIALTTVTYSPSTGRILDADMELVAWDGLVEASLPQSGPPPDGWYFSCAPPSGLPRCTAYEQTGCYSMDLQNTIAHEAGHFIGLAHPCEGANCGDAAMRETTMYPAAQIGEIKKRVLEADDVAGVCTVYPAGAGTPTCASSCEEDSSGCGCGTASPTGLVSALLGLAALAPRLRRRRRQDTIAAA